MSIGWVCRAVLGGYKTAGITGHASLLGGFPNRAREHSRKSKMRTAAQAPNKSSWLVTGSVWTVGYRVPLVLSNRYF